MSHWEEKVVPFRLHMNIYISSHYLNSRWNISILYDNNDEYKLSISYIIWFLIHKLGSLIVSNDKSFFQYEPHTWNYKMFYFLFSAYIMRIFIYFKFSYLYQKVGVLNAKLLCIEPFILNFVKTEFNKFVLDSNRIKININSDWNCERNLIYQKTSIF